MKVIILFLVIAIATTVAADDKHLNGSVWISSNSYTSIDMGRYVSDECKHVLNMILDER